MNKPLNDDQDAGSLLQDLFSLLGKSVSPERNNSFFLINLDDELLGESENGRESERKIDR